MIKSRQVLQGQKQCGFTIVELLIVIVIIGVLAAITVVVFNGVQGRATNASRISSAQTFLKAIEGYIAQNGRIPGDPAAYGSCLGRNSVNICNGVSSADIAAGRDSEPDPVLDAELRTIISQIPSVPNQPVVPNEEWYTPREAIGPILLESSSRFVDDEPIPWAIHFWLQGSNVPCGLTVLRDMGWDPVEGRTIYQQAGISSYTLSQAGVTECIVPISIR